MGQFFQFSLGQSFWFTWFTVHIWYISVSFHVCTHLLANTDSTAKAYGYSIPWHHSTFDSQGAFLSTCGQGGLLTLGMRNMWSEQGSASSSLNCPAILVLKFWFIRNESPIFYVGGRGRQHLPPASPSLCPGFGHSISVTEALVWGLPWWFSGWESAFQYGGLDLDPGKLRFHMPQGS